MRTLVPLAAGVLLALVAGAGWSGCGCDDEPIVPITSGDYALVEPDPAPYVGYTLTYSREDGMVHEHFTRGGVVHDTVYAVTATSP